MQGHHPAPTFLEKDKTEQPDRSPAGSQSPFLINGAAQQNSQAHAWEIHGLSSSPVPRYPSTPNVCLSQHLCPISCPLELVLVHPAKEKHGSAPETNPLGSIFPSGCARASSCSLICVIYSFVLFTPSLAGKEQPQPFPASRRMQGPRFCHAGGFLQHYRGAGGSPRSLSSSASPGSCTIKQLPRSTSELPATQQKKKEKKEKRGKREA